mmetsp:Transcript_22690/g.64245  ORF Transcript_22690/g.64245 Transcript_22690/m.64245 type:complete len:238 (+) Transcript_22690:1063-1776(+)
MAKMPSSERLFMMEARTLESSYRFLLIARATSGSMASMTTTSNLSAGASFVGFAPYRSTNHCLASSLTTVTTSSSKQTLARPSKSEQFDMAGMAVLTMSMNSSSISISVADWTVLCLRTSRREAPSPPPTMATCWGLAWANMAGWTMASWYSLKLSVSDWSTPSKNNIRSGVTSSAVVQRGSPGCKLCLMASSYDGDSSTPTTSQTSTRWYLVRVLTTCSLTVQSKGDQTIWDRSEL